MVLGLLSISWGEILIIFLVVLLLFGSSKIPDFARTLGKGMNEFRKATDEIKREFQEETKPIADELKGEQAQINKEMNQMSWSVDTEREGNVADGDSSDFKVKEVSSNKKNSNRQSGEARENKSR